MKTNKLFSFDVYDTCISRTYEKPSDLFYHLGTLISPNKDNALFCDNFAKDFSRARKIAENLACKQHGRRRSCRLEEIYSLLSVPDGCKLAKSEIMDLELQLEEKCTYGITSTKTIIDNIRNEGHRIIFISDMYLDSFFIKKLLIKHGFFDDSDQLYVSSETTLTKRSGMLFRHVFDSEGISGGNLTHFGDDYLADIIMARKLGIDAKYIDHTHIQKYETIFGQKKFSPLVKRINSIPKHIRLQYPGKFTEVELKLFSIVAPAIIAFSLWTLKITQTQNINNLYFLSRDGDLPYKISDIFKKFFLGTNIRFIYGSRKSWLPPSISLSNQQWLHLAIPEKSYCSLRDLLERLSFNENDILNAEDMLKGEGFSIHESSDRGVIIDRFMAAIETPEFKDLLELKIQTSRNALIKYLYQEGVLSNESCAIIDSGWNLNCQAALRRVIDSTDLDIDIAGFYFGLAPNHLPKKVAGIARSFTKKTSIFPRRRYVIESCFLTSSLQSTNGYRDFDSHVAPIFSNQSKSQFELDYAEKLHSFTIEYAKSIVNFEISLDHFYENEYFLKKILNTFISNPTSEISRYLSNITVNTDTRHADEFSSPLCRRLNYRDLFDIIPCTFLSKNLPPHPWLEASSSLSSPPIKFICFFLSTFDIIRNYIKSLRAEAQ